MTEDEKIEAQIAARLTKRQKFDLRIDHLVRHNDPHTQIMITIVIGEDGISHWMVNQISRVEGIPYELRRKGY